MSRKDYHIRWNVDFMVEKEIVYILPSIIWQPWKYRQPGVCVIEIGWLNFRLTIGTWRKRKEVK